MKKREKILRKQRSARQKLRRGWIAIVLAVVAIPLLYLLAHTTQQSGQSVEPGYTYEVAGQWELTGFRTLGPTAADGAGVSVSADNSAIVYEFAGEGDRAQIKVAYSEPGVSTYAVKERYNPDDHVQLVFYFEREADSEETHGDVSVMLYLADSVELGADGEVDLNIRSPFKRYYSGDEDMEPATNANTKERNGKRAITANTYLPEGQTDGEAFSIVLDVTDEQSGVRTLAVWDYRWRQGPITVEVPPMYGPIEYYDSLTGQLARLLAVLCAVAIPVLLIRQLVLAVKVKKETAAPTETNGGATNTPNQLNDKTDIE